MIPAPGIAWSQGIGHPVDCVGLSVQGAADQQEHSFGAQAFGLARNGLRCRLAEDYPLHPSENDLPALHVIRPLVSCLRAA